MLTKQAKKLKLVTERAKPAEISIRGMLGRQEWLVPLQKKEGHLYQGKLSQLGQENTQIQTGGSKVEQSFVNFNTLF